MRGGGENERRLETGEEKRRRNEEEGRRGVEEGEVRKRGEE